jgi:hypothetical protein
VINPAAPDGEALDNETAPLRGLDVAELRNSGYMAHGVQAASAASLPRHLLFRVLAAVKGAPDRIAEGARS